MARLSERDLGAEVLVGKGRSVRSVAMELGVNEGMLQYRSQRRAVRVVDGRHKGRPDACDAVADVIEVWIERQDWDGESGRSESIKSLYEDLVSEHGYFGSYKPPKIRDYCSYQLTVSDCAVATVDAS